MRTGGASTSGFKSYKKGLQEHLRAYRENGVYSNVVFDCLRYPFKLASILIFRALEKCRKKITENKKSVLYLHNQ